MSLHSFCQNCKGGFDLHNGHQRSATFLSFAFVFTAFETIFLDNTAPFCAGIVMNSVNVYDMHVSRRYTCILPTHRHLRNHLKMISVILGILSAFFCTIFHSLVPYETCSKGPRKVSIDFSLVTPVDFS